MGEPVLFKIFKWIRVKFLIYHYIYIYIYIYRKEKLIRNESLKKGKGTNIQIFLNVLDALEFSDNIVIVFPLIFEMVIQMYCDIS